MLSKSADFLCRTDDYDAPEHERSVASSDPTGAVAWRLEGEPMLLAKDLAGKPLGKCEVFEQR